MSITDDVRAFHTTFGQSTAASFTDMEVRDLRANLIDEEYLEFNEADMQSDPAEMLDALVDLVYVAVGTAVSYGWDFDEAWRRVHAANMAKAGGPMVNGKVEKPPGWKPPVLKDLVQR